MNQFFYQITRKASDLINSDDYREKNITRQTAFTRNRKLSFPVMIVLLLNFLTRTMQIELDDFFANVLDAGTDSVTKQAFFKARKNILPDAFKELFLMTRDMVLNKNKIKHHKGYRILAIDGSELRLDKTKENKDIFLPRNHSPENKTNATIKSGPVNPTFSNHSAPTIASNELKLDALNNAKNCPAANANTI